MITRTILALLLSCIPALAQFGFGRGSSIPTAGLVVKYTFTEGTGQHIANSAALAPPNVNLFSMPEQEFANASFWSTSATVTEGAGTAPNGLNTATRINWTSGGLKSTTETVSGPAGQYTISVYIMSNTGLSQKVRLAYNDGSLHLSSDKTVTTSWTRISNTFTAASPIVNAGIYVDTALDAVDSLILGTQLEPGATATPYYSGFNGTLGKFTSVETPDPAWSGHGSIDCSAGVRYTSAVGDLTNLTGCTVYALVKWTAAPASSGFGPTVNNIAGNARDIQLGGNPKGFTNNPVDFWFAGLQCTNNTYSEITSNQWCVISGTYDGAVERSHIGDQKIGLITNVTASINLYSVAISAFNFTQNWPGEVAEVLIYNTGHSKSQSAQVTRALKAQANLKGLQLTQRKFVCFQGDSITTGLGANASYAYLACMSNSVPHVGPVVNNALGGRRLELINGGVVSVTQLQYFDLSYLAVNPVTRVWSIQIGANDLGTATYATGTDYYNAVKAVCLQMRSMGYKILLGTVLANASSTVNTKRAVFNTACRNDPSFYDALADYDTTPLGVEGNAGNATYFQDGIHPTSYGHTLMAPVCLAALNSIP